MVDCLISFGSNLGNGRQTYAALLDALRAEPRLEHVRSSELYLTRPIGGDAPQANYLNAAIRFATDLEPLQLLNALHALERLHGRVRTTRWGPRTIDLDLLLYSRQQLRLPIEGGEELVIPHPRMSFRRFVLRPASEVAAEMEHPPTGMTIGGLLEHLDTTANGIAVMGDRRSAQPVLEFLDAHDRDSRKRVSTTIGVAPDFSCSITSEMKPDEFPPHGNRFAILPVNSSDRWDQLRRDVKLLVVWRRDLVFSQVHFVQSLVHSHAGPRLELETDDPRLAALEIAAAASAMLPETVG